MAREGEHIRIGYTIWPTGTAPLSWRLPGAWTDPFSFKAIKETAHQAERGKLDFYFVGDQYGGDPGAQYRSHNNTRRPESFTTAAYVAGLTENLGVIATTNTTYSSPYHTARQTAQLDWVSNGRALWNIVTGHNTRPAGNFGREVHWDNARRYDWAEEFVQVVSRLWDSWDDDAVVADAASGLFIDPDRVREIGFHGEFFDVRGPLNIGRPPQGQVPILHAGSSERSKEYGARFADSRFFNKPNPEYYADVKGRLAKYGRRPEDQVLLAGLTILVAPTEREAKRRQELIDELSRVDYDPRVIRWDLSIEGDVRTDVPLSDLQELSAADLERIHPTDLALQAARGTGGGSNLADLVELARQDLGEGDVTLNDVYSYYVRRGSGHDNYFVGDPVQTADWLEEKFETYSLDGVNLFTPYLPTPLYDFVDLVIPELQRRGRFHKEYGTGTIRERWGLDRPASQYEGKKLVAPRGEIAVEPSTTAV